MNPVYILILKYQTSNHMHFTNHNHNFDCFLLCLENYDDENHNIIVDGSLCLFCDHWMIRNFKIYISNRSKPKRYYVQQKALANIYITRAPWQCRLQYQPRHHCGHKLHKREFSEHPLQEETLLSWRKRECWIGAFNEVPKGLSPKALKWSQFSPNFDSRSKIS